MYEKKKWYLLLTAVGICIIFLAMYFIFGNPLHYKVIEKDTNEYLHTIKDISKKKYKA